MIDLSTYKNPLLLFSGGKDAMATLLYLLENSTGGFKLLYVDTEDTFDETKYIIDIIEGKVGSDNFIRLRTNVENNIAKYGYPSDIVPVDNGKNIRMINSDTRPIKIRSYLECCMINITAPAMHYAKAIGCELLITGQRKSDPKKSIVNNYEIIDGIKYYFPLDDWNDVNVTSYLKANNCLFPHFERSHSSLDCKKCTAYWSDTSHVKKLLREKYPEDFEIVTQRMQDIKNEILYSFNNIDKMLGEDNG